VSANFVYKLVL